VPFIAVIELPHSLSNCKSNKKRRRTEENPAARKIKPEKKEEDISANLLKKIHRKKIHSQLPALYPFGFAAGSL
jgi:hypothetical protein